MTNIADVAARAAADSALWTDFETLCDFGGRLAGGDGEKRALGWLKQRGQEASGVAARVIAVPYGGWRALSARLDVADGETARAHPLVRTVATPPGGLDAEVIDLGRGTPEEFEAHGSEIRGRIALVRHELMFAAGTIHRRRKYDMACAAGAVGFLIAGPHSGDVVAGSSGREDGGGIPAVGIAPETAARLARTAAGRPRARLTIATEESPAQTETLLFDMPGQVDEWVVVSAHVDGHDLAESAMDNASGVAAALAVARALRPQASTRRRGVRLAFFSVEEWALTGSAQYVAAMTPAQRASIALNVNLDSVAGAANLSALTSGFAGLEPFLLRTADVIGRPLRCVRPLAINSDHANFAQAGIPAFRLVAGYDKPDAHLRHVLTSADTRDKIALEELAEAARLSTAIAAMACDANPSEAGKWRNGQTGV